METVTAEPSMAEPSKSCTCPFAAFVAFTAIEKEMLTPLAAFVLVTVIFVVVATGPPPPPPLLLQPNVKLSKHTRPSPSAAR